MYVKCLKNVGNVGNCRGSEHVILKYATLAYGSLWVKGTWETTDTRWTFWLSLFFLKAGNKTPMWKVPSLYQEEGRHLCPWRLGVEARRNLHINTLLTLIFRGINTFPQLTAVAQTSLFCHVSTTYYSLSKLVYKFGPYLLCWIVIFFWWKPHVHVKIMKYNFMLFCCLMSVPTGDPKRVEEKSYLPYKI